MRPGRHAPDEVSLSLVPAQPALSSLPTMPLVAAQQPAPVDTKDPGSPACQVGAMVEATSSHRARQGRNRYQDDGFTVRQGPYGNSKPLGQDAAQVPGSVILERGNDPGHERTVVVCSQHGYPQSGPSHLVRPILFEGSTARRTQRPTGRSADRAGRPEEQVGRGIEEGFHTSNTGGPPTARTGYPQRRPSPRDQPG